ncbi:MAG: 1-deoxy-D-xylulose-5-phosphate synthase [Thermodesulfobacteriota bacterium]
MKRKLLAKIDTPKDLKKLRVDKLPQLACEVRDLIFQTVSRTGGHLSSSLGAVDIAIALHYAFETPGDKIIWDVGHQAYAHKILTGRKNRFHTIRQSGGISGFPTPSESPYDAFVAGHSGTSISSALGMVVTRDLKGEDYSVIAVIGDGSMTSGLAFEGLNQAGHIKKNLIVILNDNEMSISKNVGAISSFLSRKFTGRSVTKLEKEFKSLLHSIPKIGDGMISLARRAEDSLISFFTPGMLFEGLGFHYIGPLDGHNIEQLVRTFQNSADIDGPILIHVRTTKGKGFSFVENNPSLFHGVSPFDPETGNPLSTNDKSPTYTKVFSNTLTELAKEYPKIVAITAAMSEGTGLKEFSNKFPERFFDVGIAEQHAVTFATGISASGFIPIVAIYSTFLQRSYDQIIHDVCLQNLHVVFAIDRAGIVGADGATHQGLFDLSYLRHIPNMVVMAPKDECELRDMMKTAIEYEGPIAIRYPRGKGAGVKLNDPIKTIKIGKAELLRKGKDLAILAVGDTVYRALEAANRLAEDGFSITVVNNRFIKPVDRDIIINLSMKINKFITVEDNTVVGGFGSAVMEVLRDERVTGITVKCLGIHDLFVRHAPQGELRKETGIDINGIEEAARGLLEKRTGEKKRAS